MYPACIVLSPTILLYEKVSPGIRTVPFILFAANIKFVVRFLLLAEYLVENSDNKSGKASVPIIFVVTFGYNVFKGIIYSSFSSVNKFLASSNDIAKSVPFSLGCIT